MKEESFEDELSKREAMHVTLDEAFAGLNPPSESGAHIPPSRRLYRPFNYSPRSAEGWDAEVVAWRARFGIAEEMDTYYAKSMMVPLLLAIELPLLCRDPDANAVKKMLLALPAAIGRAVHNRISNRYLAAYTQHTVSCDGKVFFRDGRQERLSALARTDPRSTFGALNFSLAGQRNDIVDLDLGEMWEIKPANLTRRNLMQLWGYVDNYEVARVMCHYRGDPVPPVIRPGNAGHLPAQVLAPFPLEFTGGVRIIVVPVVNPLLPGVIGYTIRPGLNRRPNEALSRATMRSFDANVQTVVGAVLAGDRAAATKLEEEARRFAIVCGVVVVVTAAVALGFVLAPVAAAGAAGSAAVGTGVAAEVATTTLTANVIALAGRAAAGAAVEQMGAQAAAAGLSKAAGIAIAVVAGSLFELPPAVSAMGVEAGCEVGANCLPQTPR